MGFIGPIFPCTGIAVKRFLPAHGNRPTSGWGYPPTVEELDLWGVLAANLSKLMAIARAEKTDKPKTRLELEVRSGVGKSTIYRLLPKSGQRIVRIGPLGMDKLIGFAKAFRVPVWTLLQAVETPADTLVPINQERLQELVDQRATEILHEVSYERRLLQTKNKPGRPGVGDPFATVPLAEEVAAGPTNVTKRRTAAAKPKRKAKR